MYFSRILFVYIDICKQKCTFAGVDIYYLVRKLDYRNTMELGIPRNRTPRPCCSSAHKLVHTLI